MGWLLGVCRGLVMRAYVLLPVTSKQSRDSRQFPAGKAGMAGKHWAEKISGWRESPKCVPQSQAG